MAELRRVEGMAILAEDFRRDITGLFDSREENGDLTLIVGAAKVQVKAHKLIMMARLPFPNEIRDFDIDSLQIPDLEPDCFLPFLHFLYTGETNNLSENAEKLIKAIIKYGRENYQLLFELCVEQLITNLQVSNVIYFLSFADLNSLNYLKEKALAFCVENSSEVVEEKSFWELQEKNCDLCLEIVRGWAGKEPSNPNPST